MVELSNAYPYAVGALVLWRVWGLAATYSVERMDDTAVVLETYLVGVAVVWHSTPASSGASSSTPTSPSPSSGGLAMSLGTVSFYRALDLGQLSGVGLACVAVVFPVQ